MHVRENNFSKISLDCKIHFIEEVYYLKQVFHLLSDKSVASAEALLYISLILWIVV